MSDSGFGNHPTEPPHGNDTVPMPGFPHVIREATGDKSRKNDTSAKL